MEQIAGAMMGINQSTTDTAGSARQLQQAAEGLDQLARRLAAQVADYRPNGHV